MGIQDEQKTGKTTGKRGTVNNGKRLSALLGRTRGNGGMADWGAADAAWLQAVIVAVTRLGGAVSFGLSRDQGAYSIMILLDGERETLWFNQDSDLGEELQKVYEAFNTGV